VQRSNWVTSVVLCEKKMGCFIHMHTCNTYNIYSIQVNAIELKEVRPCPHLVDGGASSAEGRGGVWRSVEAAESGGGAWRRRRVEAQNETPKMKPWSGQNGAHLFF